MIGKGKQIKMLSGKVMGYLREDGILTLVRKEKHYFRLYKGWGVNKELIKELKDIDGKLIEIKTELRILRIPLVRAIAYGIEYKNPKDEKDLQLIIPEKYFDIWEV